MTQWKCFVPDTFFLWPYIWSHMVLFSKIQHKKALVNTIIAMDTRPPEKLVMKLIHIVAIYMVIFRIFFFTTSINLKSAVQSIRQLLRHSSCELLVIFSPTCTQSISMFQWIILTARKCGNYHRLQPLIPNPKCGGPWLVIFEWPIYIKMTNYS